MDFFRAVIIMINYSRFWYKTVGSTIDTFHIACIQCWERISDSSIIGSTGQVENI